jgi:hypothetical protein
MILYSYWELDTIMNEPFRGDFHISQMSGVKDTHKPYKWKGYHTVSLEGARNVISMSIGAADVSRRL